MFKSSFLLFLLSAGLWSGCKKHHDERDPYIGDYYGYVVEYSWQTSNSYLTADTTYVKVGVNKDKEYPYINVTFPGQHASLSYKVSGGNFQKPTGATNNMTLSISSGGDLDLLYHPGGHGPSYTRVIAHR